MNEAIMMGVQPMRFTTDDGNQMEGVKVHMAVFDPNVTGRAVVSQFIRQNIIENLPYFPAVGENCLCYFNMKGKIAGFSKVDSK